MYETEDTDNEDESNDSNDDITVIKKERNEELNRSEFTKRPNRMSNDVNEGKTVFLKNLPFSVKNDELKKYMEQFGPVYYALVCNDPLTEYSRGTAFVKFQVEVVKLILDVF